MRCCARTLNLNRVGKIAPVRGSLSRYTRSAKLRCRVPSAILASALAWHNPCSGCAEASKLSQWNDHQPVAPFCESLRMQEPFAIDAPMSARPYRILLAEDDEAFRGLLADVLRGDGYEVEEASDGRVLLDTIAGALTAYESLEGIDLILSDIRMPQFNALEVLSGMRGACVNVPVVLMTAFGDDRTHERARQLGVACVLDKPFDVDDLRAAVDIALKRARNSRTPNATGRGV